MASPENSNNNQEGEKENISEATQEQSPAELRQERIEKINQELSEFNYTSQTEEEVEKTQRKRDEEPKSISSEKLRQKMIDESMELAQVENERFDELSLEKQDLENLSMADGLIGELEEIGVKISENDREAAIKILTSADLPHFDRAKLVEVLNIDTENKEVMSRLYKASHIIKIFNKLLRGKLITQEYKEMLLASDVKLIGPGQVEIRGYKINLEDLNDPEVADLGVDKIKQIIRDILNDKGSVAGQGMFWNALVPKDLPYVIKTQRRKETQRESENRDNDLYQYPIIRDSIGEDFLPKQAVLQSENSGQMHVLQEKMNLDEMTPLRYANIDDFLNGEYGEQVGQALESEENKQVLAKFIEGVEKLYKDHKLMIDTIGENLFFNVGKNGELTIKLVDYGCFYNWKEGDEEPNEDMKKFLEYMEKLKQLI